MFDRFYIWYAFYQHQTPKIIHFFVLMSKCYHHFTSFFVSESHVTHQNQHKKKHFLHFSRTTLFYIFSWWKYFKIIDVIKVLLSVLLYSTIPGPAPAPPKTSARARKSCIHPPVSLHLWAALLFPPIYHQQRRLCDKIHRTWDPQYQGVQRWIDGVPGIWRKCIGRRGIRLRGFQLRPYRNELNLLFLI